LSGRPSLADDLLPSIAAIAEYIYGEANSSTERRIRHMVARGDIPAKKTRGRIESRRSWVDSAYAEPDPHPNGKGGK
jgi:hypothetical protein